MKNLRTLFLAAVLCIVGGVTLQAQITDVSELSNDKVYTITTARGGWTLNTAKTALASTHTSTGSTVYAGASTEEGATEFAIYLFEGNYYIYSTLAKGFVVLNNGSTQISSLLGTAIAFETTGNATYPLKAGTLLKDRYANNNNSGGINIDTWKTTDDGNRLAIVEARDLTATEKAEIEGYIAAAPMSAHKAWTITADRGQWCANAAGTSLTTTKVNTSPAAGYDQFALVTLDNVTYIYNVGTKKFIRKDGSLTEGRGEAINIRLSGNATRPYMFYFPDDEGNIYFNMQTSGGYAMNTYASPDAGNMQSITLVEGVDPYADALAEYQRTITVTYKLMYEGEQVATATSTERLGVDASLPSSIDKGFFTYTYDPVYPQTNAATITVTATPIFTISPDYVGATWYNMYIRQNNRWVPYSEETEPYKPYDATDADKATKELQWAFVGNPFTTGVKVINRAAGRGKSLKKDGSNAVIRDGDTYWDIFGRNGGILLREQGTTNNFINQAGSANGNLQFWNSSYAWNDNGSTMWLVEAPVTTTTITYNVKFNGSTVTSATTTAVVDDPTPLTLISSVISRDFVELGGDDTHNVVENDQIDVTATWVGPFEISDDYTSAHWYDMAVRSNWYVTSDNVEADGALKTVLANALGLGEDAYQWAFVGDPWHLKIYNKDKGENLIYAWTSTDNGSVPAFTDASDETYWWIKKSTSSVAKSFMLTVPDYGYQVNQFGGAGGSLKVWAATGTNDVGSAFTIFEVPTNYAEFLNDEVGQYMATGYFNFKDDVKTSIGWNDSYRTECTLEQYKNVRAAYAALDKSDINLYLLPSTGYYRIDNKMESKNNYNGHHTYIRNITGEVKSHYNDDDYLGAYTIIKVEVNPENATQYAFKLQGKYLTTRTSGTKVGLSDTPFYFNTEVAVPGYGSFTNNGSVYLHSNAVGSYGQTGELIGFAANGAAEASDWEFFDATSFDLNITSAGWATLYVPFPVTIPAGVKAYYGVINETKTCLNLTQITGTTIPAGTAVLLEGDEGTYTFNIAADVAAIEDNALTGNYTEYTPDAATENVYTLQIVDELGFHLFNGTTIGANKAWVSLPAGSDVKALQVRFGEDGVSAMTLQPATDVIYDLAGRRVERAQKGVYIINGRKVLK